MIKKKIRETWRMVLVGVTVFLAFILIISAYGGMVDPNRLPAAALVTMGFPIAVIMTLVMTAVLAVCRSRLAFVGVAALVISLPAILNFAPVNFTKKLTDEEKQRSFTVMTFNCLHWGDYDNPGDTIKRNLSMEYVLRENPDILVVQESEMTPMAKVIANITAAQEAAFTSRYIYRQEDTSSPGLAIYSKFPITRVLFEENMCGTGTIAAYRVSLQGHLLTIFNLHLQSLLLTPADKALFKQMTSAKGNTHDLLLMRDNVFSKLYSAYILRAEQARYIRNILDERRGNTIVCGDFNDVPGCYAVRTLKGDDMRDAYADAALGPAITYGKNRFYFRIDHMLYRGDFRVKEIHKGKPVGSDHYPLMATFVWDE